MTSSTMPINDKTLGILHFRMLRPDDWRRLQRFHSRLSPRTVQLRFHGSKRALSEPLAHRFCDVDGKDNVAIVVTRGTRGRIVGVARYSRVGPVTAEVAFVVEDAYQHHAIGHRLLHRLVMVALTNGITEFVAEILAGNVAMFRLMEELGPPRLHREHGEYQVYVDLSPHLNTVVG
jgi:RimJ/RimL family protein N-acetyltransferase